MKKIISIFLALALLFTCIMFTACDDTETADASVVEKSDAELINDALKKTSELESVSAKFQMDINMYADDLTSMPISVSGKMKGNNINGDDAVISLDMEMSMLGEKFNTEMYQEGQWCYVVMDGLGYKVNVNDIEGGGLGYAETAGGMLEEIPAELLEGVKLVKEEDGSQSAKISIPVEEFMEGYNDVIKSVTSEIGAGMGELKISNAEVGIVLANGYLTKYDITWKMDFDMLGVAFSADVKMALECENPGQPVTVTPPEGYQNFEEMNMGSIEL